MQYGATHLGNGVGLESLKLVRGSGGILNLDK